MAAVTEDDIFEATIFLQASAWLEEITEAMYAYYGIDHRPSEYRRKRRSCASVGGSKLPRIEYAQSDVLRMFRGDFREYVKTAHVWGRFLNSAMAYRGLYALAVHEFAHVHDRHINGPCRRKRNGDRIYHGPRFCASIREIRRHFKAPALEPEHCMAVFRLRGLS